MVWSCRGTRQKYLLMGSFQQRHGAAIGDDRYVRHFYHLYLQYPSELAQQADNILWQMLELSAGLHIPQAEEGLGVECCLDIPVQHVRQRSFQSSLVRMPVRVGA